MSKFLGILILVLIAAVGWKYLSPQPEVISVYGSAEKEYTSTALGFKISYPDAYYMHEDPDHVFQLPTQALFITASSTLPKPAMEGPAYPGVTVVVRRLSKEDGEKTEVQHIKDLYQGRATMFDKDIKAEGIDPRIKVVIIGNNRVIQHPWMNEENGTTEVFYHIFTKDKQYTFIPSYFSDKGTVEITHEIIASFEAI